MNSTYDKAKAVADARGLLHQRYLEVLRLHLKTMPEKDVAEEISRMNNIDVLKALWEAGLSRTLQKIVLDRVRLVTMGR